MDILRPGFRGFLEETKLVNVDLALYASELKRLWSGQLPYPQNPLDWKDANGLRLDIAANPAVHLHGYGADLILTVVIGLMFLILRSMLHTWVLHPFAKSIGINKIRPRRKFAESTWFFLYYLPIFCWGFSLVTIHEFAWPFSRMLTYYPHQLYTVSLKMYLLIQSSFYVSSLVVVIVLEERRKDFVQMAVHHVATLGLMFAAQLYSYRNFAIVILVLHDFSDVFLYLAKSLHYAKYKMIKNIAFGIFAVSFAVARLIYFPAVIYSWHILSDEMLEYKWEYPHTFSSGLRWSVTFFLCILQGLHIIWFKAIIRTINQALAEDDFSDPRSDDDEDD